MNERPRTRMLMLGCDSETDTSFAYRALSRLVNANDRLSFVPLCV
jgi:hypothetical protein